VHARTAARRRTCIMRVAVSCRKSRLFRGIIKMDRTFCFFHLISLPGVVCGFEKTCIAPAGRNLPLTTSIRKIYCAAVRFIRRPEKPFLRGPEKINATSVYAMIFEIVCSSTLSSPDWTNVSNQTTLYWVIELEENSRSNLSTFIWSI